MKVTDEGLYKVGEEIYKAVRGQTSGKLYAKRLVHGDSGHKFVFAPGEIHRIASEDRMTPDQAKEFADEFKSCVNCDRPLSRNESLKRGYGPTCALNLGWPYDQNAD